jgi:NAD+ synthase (glutamine-hydrolysing)
MVNGHAILYGDMAKWIAIIKDVTKTMVCQLASYQNQVTGQYLIPSSVIAQEPQVKLRPRRVNFDRLQSYDVLDPMLVAYVEAFGRDRILPITSIFKVVMRV